MNSISNHSPRGNEPHSPQFFSLDTPVESKYARPIEIEYSGFVLTPSPISYIPLLALLNRIWRILTFVIGWGVQVITKTMECFQSIQFKQPKPPILKAQKEYGKEFCQLFHSYICYEKFRDQVLLTTYKKEVEIREEPLFNNYNSTAYYKLKKQNRLPTQYSDEERELRAGIAVYDAIVDLYVKRFLIRYSELNQEEYLPSLRTIALIIAIKLSQEKDVFNYHFQYPLFPFIGLKKLQKMEIEFEEGINWDFSITEIFDDEEIDNQTENEFKFVIVSTTEGKEKKNDKTEKNNK